MVLPVTSREYKVILKKEYFQGPREEVSKAILVFWKTFKEAIKDHVLDVSGKLDDWKDDRLIRFFDTPDGGLVNEFHVLRERIDFAKGADRTLTLKFRSPDRFVSQGPDLTAAKRFRDDVKFEEDLKLPFRSLYSRSNKIAIDEDSAWPDLGAAVGFFPGFVDSIPNFSKDTPLLLVNGKAHRELVVKGAKLLIGETPEVKSSCALILWYPADQDALTTPDVVEFSFNYEVPVEEGGETLKPATARRAYGIFKRLEDKSGRLSDWVDPEGITKTELAYG